MAYIVGLTDAQLRATPVPVSGTVAVTGTFWQATQPVSGTFWQATQPVSIAATVAVSGPLTDTQLRAAAVPVSGTFFQATQPVSGTFFQATQPVSLAVAPTTPVTGTFWQATQPVSGTFWQATQPVSIAATVAVSGPLTDTQLRASAVPVSGTFWQATQPVSGTFFQATQPVSAASLPLPTGAATETTLAALNIKMPALGQATMANSQPVVIASNQSAIPVSGITAASPEASALFRGRASTFRTPGRAGTAGQKIFALHNATGSTRVVHLNQLAVDLYQTVIKAVTVAPPIIRVHKFTAVPTNGTVLSKVSKDSALTDSAGITVWGDASADGTLSGTTLTVTIPTGNILTQEYAGRLITAAGYEMMDRIELLDGKDIVLRALEGVVIELVYTVATQNPATDMWIATCDWWVI